MDMDISLSPQLADIVRHKVETGMYGSPEEVVQEALYLLENYDQLRAIQTESLRKRIEEGRKSGPPIPAEEVFADIYKEIEEFKR